jgi:arylsulfatase A-like enzyme
MESRLNRRAFLKLMGLLPVASLAAPPLWRSALGGPSQAGAPSIFILLFDTLSAQHMSLYGYARDTTPNLKRFADRATVYHAHYAAGNYTTPGTASLLTGTYPWSHRAYHMHGVPLPEYAHKNLFSLLPQDMHVTGYTHNLLAYTLLQHFRTGFDDLLRPRDLSLSDSQLADRLFPNDYNAAIWSERVIMRGKGGRASSLFGSPLYRMLRLASKRGLEADHLALFPRGLPNLDDLYFLLEDILSWIMDQMVALPRPFLAYYHILPPHEPYCPRRDFIDIFRDGYQPLEKPKRFFAQQHAQRELNRQRRAYDEYLAYTDAEFGRLLDFMQHQGVLDNTYVIVTSDHGELFERGIRGHVTPALYDPLLRVPLLISRPGQAQREDVQSVTSCVDLLPTILSILGQSVPDWCEGTVLPPFTSAAGGSERTVYAVEAKSNPLHGRLSRASVAAINQRYKLVSYFGYNDVPEAYELYDLHDDPNELTDLFADRPTLATDLLAELQDRLVRTDTLIE